MARIRKSTLSFDAITLEGSLLSSAKFAAIAERKAEEQSDADYNIPKGLTLRDETARYFRMGQALFRELHASSTPSRHKTIEFTEELLRGVFGFTDIQPVHAPQFRDERQFPLTLEALAGRVPVIVVPPADDLDLASHSLSHDRRRSAASALQDWLNADDSALWGLCTNGESLRVLRDNESLTRPAYLEADLRQIFEAEDYAGFSALWLVLHISRFGRAGSQPTDCSLERWRESGSKEGLAARDRLRDGVEEALLALGTGFLTHPSNTELSARLRDGTWPIDEYFRQLLRLVYRLIFLLAAEDRKLLHMPEASAGQRKLYAEGYSLGAQRDRAIRRSGWDDFHDRWSGLRVTFRALANGEPRLGLPALGGIFAATATPELDRAQISNRYLMEAIFRLAWLRDDGLLMPVNWRDMETEELGSVYESLLELTPRLSPDGREFKFAEGIQTRGNARKTSGSYYTPDSLVQVLLDSALDPVLDRIESESEDPIRGLLGVTVIDPACGSGHFLLAAARRIAKRVVRLRCGDIHSEQDRLRALRDVVRSCIHGVDRNPMAVELTKVALWIETVELGKPLGFLDANIRLGDSLLGIFDLKALEKGIPDAAYKPLTGDHKPTAKDFDKRNKSEKGQKTRLLDFAGNRSPILELPPLAQSLRAVRELPEDTVEQIEAKRERFSTASHDPRLQSLAQAADLYIAAFLTPKTEAQSLDLQTALVPTTEDVWAAMRGATVYGPRLGAARQLASEARTFHWPLEFPDILSKGGFDIVLGNPPWERIKLEEQEFFSAREPSIAEARNGAARGGLIQALRSAPYESREYRLFAEFELAKRISEASSEFARLREVDSGRFPLAGRGNVNTYALFAELFARITRTRGRAGVIVPTGIATDATTAPFFAWLVDNKRIAQLIDFENRDAIFPSVHRSFKFSLLTTGHEITVANFAFFLAEPGQMAEPERRFTLSPEQIALINPESKTVPVFRSRFDAHLTAKIYRRIPVLMIEGCEAETNRWQLTFHSRLWHMTEDSEWFRSAEQLSQDGFVRAGRDWVPQDVQDEESSREPYVPLYEAKMMHFYDHRFGSYLERGDERGNRVLPETSFPQYQDRDFEVTPFYYIPKSLLLDRLGAWKETSTLLAFKDVTAATNERTAIFSFLPVVAVGNSAPLIFSPLNKRLLAALLANLCSLTVDFCARSKVGGLHLTLSHVRQLPALPPASYRESDLSFITPRVLELTYTSQSMSPFAHDLGYDRPPFLWDEDRRALLRAELDAWYARAYGLSRDELRYILDPADVMGPDYPSETFRVLKKNEIAKFNGYRTQRLVLDAWDRMERGELHKPEPYQRPAAGTAPTVVPASPRPGVNNQPSLQFAEADTE
jgi:hypothetical protein